MSKRQLKAVILAGGESRRFGSDKAVAPWKQGTNESFLERAEQTLVHFLKTGGITEIWISRRTGQLPLAPTLHLSHAKFLIDENFSGTPSPSAQGPAAGLRAAHRQDPSSSWLVMACDLVGATTECIDFLLAGWRDHEQASAVLFEAQARDTETAPLIYEPLLGIWNPSALSLLCQTQDASPQRAARQAQAIGLKSPNPEWLINKNSN